jgi:hypothetical protein
MQEFGLEMRMEPEAFATVFPAVDEQLEAFPVYPVVFRLVGCPNRLRQYHTFLDLLFCEFFGGAWPRRCQKFYDHKGPGLSDILSLGEIENCQHILLVAMTGALVHRLDRKRSAWCHFRAEVLGIAEVRGHPRPTKQLPAAKCAA